MSEYRSSRGWAQEDFLDATNRDVHEDDPWINPEDVALFVGDQNGRNAEPTDIDIFVEPISPEPGGDELLGPEVDGWGFDDFPLNNDESSTEIGILSEWDRNPPSGPSEFLGDNAQGVETIGRYPDEPEPLAEYDSELARPLYQIDDNEGLSQALKVSEFVAAIELIDEDQRQEISELLLEFSVTRLRRWLPWLCSQKWTGRVLLLFLTFREQWESSPEWWEATFWDARFECWRPMWSRYSLSRDDLLELVHQRPNHSADQIIDESWLHDWVQFGLWRYGFLSFGGFALFRASMTDSDNWRRHVDWFAPIDAYDAGLDSYDRRHLDDVVQQLSAQSRRALSLVCHDWYDSFEWHDNLGW